MKILQTRFNKHMHNIKLSLLPVFLLITCINGMSAPPEWRIKNGCFMENNKYKFMLGPWSTLSLPEKLVDRRGPWSQHRMYYDAPDREMLNELGFNSVQMNHFMTYPMMKKYFPKLLKQKKMWYGVDYYPNAEKLCRDVLTRMNGLPIIVDWGDMGTHLGFGARARKVLKDKRFFQQTAWWTGFMPLDPSYPPAMKLLKSVYCDSTKFLLDNGGNPLLYELLNEPFYNSFSPDNMVIFKQYLENKYGSINKLNAQYGTSWKSITEAISRVEKLQDTEQGLWVDWMEFSNRLMTKYLQTFKKYILEVDRRPTEKYFCVQPQHNISEMSYNNSFSMLYHDFLDVIGLEYCGLNFGSHSIEDQELSDMMEAGFKTSTSKVLTAMAIARAYAKGRPIIDLEMSCARYTNGLRVPSRVGDLETVLWHLLMNEVSGSMIYAFSGRSWEWKNMAQAKKSARSAHYKAHMLLNPFNYPEQALLDFKRFQTSVGQLNRLLMPTPRVKGKVGVIYLARQVWLSKGSEWQRYAHYYSSLNSIHMPADFVVAEQLESADELKRFPVLFCPQLNYCSAKIKQILLAYVNSGGVIVAGADAFSHNDYGRTVDTAAILGVTTERIPPHVGTLVYADKPLRDSFLKNSNLKLAGAQPFIAWNKNGIALTVKTHGQGRLYTLGFDKGAVTLGKVFKIILKQEKVAFDNQLRLKYSPQLDCKVTMNTIDRGDRRFYFFLNWNKTSDLGTLRPRNLPEGNYYVYNVVSWKRLKSPSGNDTWTRKQITKGVPVFLPTELRALILITPEKLHYDQGPITISEVKQQAKTKHMLDLKAVQTEKNNTKQQQQALFANRMFPQIIAKKSFSINLRPYVTTSFADKISNDGKGGWTDQGEMNDLSSIPLGKQKFYGVPYEVIDPSTNSGKSCIVLKGLKRPHFPDSVKDIKVNRKAASLYFLHTMAWSCVHLMDYVIHYADNTKVVIPVRRRYEIDGWWKPSDDNLDSKNVRIAWIGKNKRGTKIGVYSFRWKNPHPDKVIASIDIIGRGRAVPAVLAITGATAEKKVVKPKTEDIIIGTKLRKNVAAIPFRMGKIQTSLKNGFTVLSVPTMPKVSWGGVLLNIRKPLMVKNGQWKLIFELNYSGRDPFGRPAVAMPIQVKLRTGGKGKNLNGQIAPLDSDPDSWQRFSIPVKEGIECKAVIFQFRGRNPDYGTLEIRNVCVVRR